MYILEGGSGDFSARGCCPKKEPFIFENFILFFAEITTWYNFSNLTLGFFQLILKTERAVYLHFDYFQGQVKIIIHLFILVALSEYFQ